MRTIYSYTEVVEWPRFASRFIGRISIVLIVLLCMGSALFTVARFVHWERQPHKPPVHPMKRIRPVVVPYHF